MKKPYQQHEIFSHEYIGLQQLFPLYIIKEIWYYSIKCDECKDFLNTLTGNDIWFCTIYPSDDLYITF